MNRLPEPLTTARLLLRSARLDDAEELFRVYCGVPDCARYLTRSVHTSVAQTATFLDKWCVQAWSQPDQSFAWVIAQRDTDTPIGTFVVVRSSHTADILFGIGTQHWGRGLVVEADQSAVAWLFLNTVRCVSYRRFAMPNMCNLCVFWRNLDS